jgi:hypothetical protein
MKTSPIPESLCPPPPPPHRVINFGEANRIIKACDRYWKNKLSELWGPALLRNDEVAISDALYKDMRTHATSLQRQILDSIFPQEAENSLALTIKDRNRVYLGGTLMGIINTRFGGAYHEKGIYLPFLGGCLEYALERDSANSQILVAKKK